jgi:hypothetical protein
MELIQIAGLSMVSLGWVAAVVIGARQEPSSVHEGTRFDT